MAKTRKTLELELETLQEDFDELLQKHNDAFDIFQRTRERLEAVRTYCLNVKAAHDGPSSRNPFSAGRCITAEEILSLLKGESLEKGCSTCKDFDPKNIQQCDECKYNPMNKSKGVIEDDC